MTTKNTPHIDFGSLDKGEQIDAYLEKVVMPLLCDELGAKLDKINSEIVLTLEHIPGSPLSVVLHRKDEETQSLIAKPLVNRNPKAPRNHGAKWTKLHLKKLMSLCDSRTSLDSIAKQLERTSSSVLAKLQQFAKDEMWAYQYLVEMYLPIQYYKD